MTDLRLMSTKSKDQDEDDVAWGTDTLHEILCCEKESKERKDSRPLLFPSSAE